MLCGAILETKRHPPPPGGDAFFFVVSDRPDSDSVEFLLDESNDLLQVRSSIDEIHIIAFDYQQWTAVIIGNPVLIMLVELLEILALDALLERAAAPGNLLDQRIDGGPEVDHQIRRLQVISHHFEQGSIVAIVAIVHLANVVEIPGENFGVFVDRSILNDRFAGFCHPFVMLEPVCQKVDLEMKRPALHVPVEIGEVGIIVDGLKIWPPAESFR